MGSPYVRTHSGKAPRRPGSRTIPWQEGSESVFNAKTVLDLDSLCSSLLTPLTPSPALFRWSIRMKWWPYPAGQTTPAGWAGGGLAGACSDACDISRHCCSLSGLSRALPHLGNAGIVLC